MKQDSEAYQPRGLCMTCNEAGSCGYLARTEGPIWRCEEFDDSGPLTPGPAATLRPHPPAAEPPRTGSGAPQGLCCNCDNRSFCGFHETREEVLYCEEYR